MVPSMLKQNRLQWSVGALNSAIIRSSILKTLEIKTFTEFQTYVCGEESARHIFRGVRDAKKHVLIPSIGRLNANQRGESGFKSFERRIFSSFKDSAFPFLKNVPSTELEWLALAQHHGLPTRLLDWSYNPLVALFFAVERKHSDASAVYVYRPRDKTLRFIDEIDPFKQTKTQKYRPRHFADRIRSQHSVFTLHHDPQTPLDEPDRSVMLSIPSTARSDMLSALVRFKIGRATLFPGLDGIAAEITANCGVIG